LTHVLEAPVQGPVLLVVPCVRRHCSWLWSTWPLGTRVCWTAARAVWRASGGSTRGQAPSSQWARPTPALPLQHRATQPQLACLCGVTRVAAAAAGPTPCLSRSSEARCFLYRRWHFPPVAATWQLWGRVAVVACEVRSTPCSCGGALPHRPLLAFANPSVTMPVCCHLCCVRAGMHDSPYGAVLFVQSLWPCGT
jgi:hypothetical protein